MNCVIRKDCRKNIFFNLLVCIICLGRFWSIRFVPDIFCDEQDILNHIQSILLTHADTEGNIFPLFSTVGGGLVTYTYLYPMAFICKIVGVSAGRVRVVQQILTIFSCYLSAKAVKNFTKDQELFRMVFVIGLTLPWGFVQANRIWDPAIVPLYFSIHFYILSAYYRKDRSAQKRSSWNNFLIISVFGSLVLLATVYPPCRIPAVAMWVYVLLWLYQENSISLKQFIWIVIVCVLLSLPLAINLLNPAFNARSIFLLVFNEDMSIKESIVTWIANFSELIGPKFLFVMGDRNYRHAVSTWGMLGLLSAIPMISVLRKPLNKVTKYMLFIICMTFLSVALTNEGMPHSLRGCLTWLPFTVLISFGWKGLMSCECIDKHEYIKWLVQIAVMISYVLYIQSYIVNYTTDMY